MQRMPTDFKWLGGLYQLENGALAGRCNTGLPTLQLQRQCQTLTKDLMMPNVRQMEGEMYPFETQITTTYNVNQSR